MILSMARVETLLDFSALEAELIPDQKALHAEDLEIFLEVLLQEATEEGAAVFEAKMADLPADEYPWSAVRARHYGQADVDRGDVEQLIRRGPPALSLVLARRPDLEPELSGDEVPEPGTPGWDSFWQAMAEWQIEGIRASMGPVGWIPMENDPKTALDPVVPPVDPVIVPEDGALPVSPPASEPASDSDEPQSEPEAMASGTGSQAADAPAGATTGERSLLRAALTSAGVVAGLGTAGVAAWYLLRSRADASGGAA